MDTFKSANDILADEIQNLQNNIKSTKQHTLTEVNHLREYTIDCLSNKMDADKLKQLEDQVKKVLNGIQKKNDNQDVLLSKKNCASCGNLLNSINPEKPEYKAWDLFPKKDEDKARKTMYGKG